MKKRVILFFSVVIILLILPISFTFASEECEHVYTDDNDCSTPATCTTCGNVAILAKEHDYSTTLSFTFNKDAEGNESFLLGGTKKAKCSNDGCSSETTIKIQPFISALGYSIKEDTYTKSYKDGTKEEITEATIISTFLFNTTEIDEYAKLIGKDIKYGTFLYRADSLILARVCSKCEFVFDGKVTVAVESANGKVTYHTVDSSWKDVPSTYTCPSCGASKTAFVAKTEAPYSTTTGKFHHNVYLPNNGVAGRINDLSVMKIGKSDYNSELVIASYIAIGNEVYYFQSGKLISDHAELVSVTCDKILKKLNEK